MKNELYHHGIDGQRWGVQHGPPYPLSRAEHRAVVKSQKATEKRKLSYSKSGKYAKRMSDDDLNATIDRLKREETYRQLVSKEKEEKRVKRETNKAIKDVKKVANNSNNAPKEQKDKNQNKQPGIIGKSVKEAIGGGIKTIGTAAFNELAKTIWPGEDEKAQVEYRRDKDGNIITIVKGKDSDSTRQAFMATQDTVNIMNYQTEQIKKTNPQTVINTISKNTEWNMPINTLEDDTSAWD